MTGILLILIFISYYINVFQVFSIGTYGVIVSDLFVLAYFLVFLKRVIWNGDSLKIVRNPAMYLYIAFIASIFLSAMNPLIGGNSHELQQFFKSFAHLIFIALFALILAVYPENRKTWENVIKAWLIMSLLINIFGIYQIAARAWDLPLAWLDTTNVSFATRGLVDVNEITQLSLKFEDFYRATSIFSEPSALASYNVIIFIFLLVPIIQGKKPFLKSKFLNILVFSAALVAIFLTFSLTGAVGLSMIIGGMFLIQRNKKLLRIIYVGMIAIVLIVASDSVVEKNMGISVVNLFSERIGGIVKGGGGMSGESFTTRMESGSITVDIWKKRPVTGVGIGLTSYYSDGKIKFSDMGVLAAFAELGIIGGSVFILLHIFLFVLSIREILIQRKIPGVADPDDERLFGIVYYFMFTMLLINFISGNNLASSFFYIPIGMLLAILNLNMQARGSKVYELKLFKMPLKDYFGTFVSHTVSNLRLKSKK